MNETDCYLSFLPCGHIFEQQLMCNCLMTGMKAGYFSGDIFKLIEDAVILKPTVFPGVPRLLNRIFGAINDQF